MEKQKNTKIYLPQDFKNLKIETIKNEINKGKISISGMPYKFYKDAWTMLLYLCNRKYDKVVDLTPNSISINDDTLVWLNYSDILAELVKYYTGKDPFDIIMEQLISKSQTAKEKIKVLENFEKQILWKEVSYYSPKEVKGMRYLYE